MLIRVLTEVDAKQFWVLRFRGLKRNPEAFGASYEEDINIPIDKLISPSTAEPLLCMVPPFLGLVTKRYIFSTSDIGP
ncbi:hypothetical protein G9F72_023705 [Clostridium estertheticum]|uniref:hypothetical protein n=1 Tax=Clostridium estertheticum TaxID=238834 RepID=UPI0013E95E0E|nr:hypothetical protein [Clostridium estertheticum]MBZ9689306.1 hypothetical protein [Clostridium estertheticum]